MFSHKSLLLIVAHFVGMFYHYIYFIEIMVGFQYIGQFIFGSSGAKQQHLFIQLYDIAQLFIIIQSLALFLVVQQVFA